MFLSIQELELRKVQFEEDFPAGEIDFGGGDVRQYSPLHVTGQAELLNNTLGEVRIQGRASVVMELQCDRCLDPVKYPIAGPFDLFYRPAPKDTAPQDIAIDEGESEIAFYEGSGIELADVLREHILLSLPMHQVCREECAGICPQCGQNRNTGTCTCTDEHVDDRWAALRELRGALRSSEKN